MTREQILAKQNDQQFWKELIAWLGGNADVAYYLMAHNLVDWYEEVNSDDDGFEYRSFHKRWHFLLRKSITLPSA
jgi:hypothetical protein